MVKLQSYQNSDTQTITDLISAVRKHDFNLPAQMVKPGLENFERLYLLRRKEEIIAYAVIAQDEIGHWLRFLDVCESYGRQGYGSLIMKRVLQDYAEIYVQSIMNSEEFYTKQGFVVLDNENVENLIMVVTQRYESLLEKWNADKAEAKAYYDDLMAGKS